METINDDADKILLYCGFNRSSKLKDIDEYGVGLFEYIMPLNERDIGNLSKVISERTADNRRIIFVLRLLIILKSTVHCVQDFQRIIRDTTLNGNEDKTTFK